jgi:hypothetical protein
MSEPHDAEEDELIVMAAEEFAMTCLSRADEAGVEIAFFSWNSDGRVNPQSAKQEFKVTAVGHDVQTFGIETIEFLNAARGYLLNQAHLMRNERNIVATLLELGNRSV